MWKLGAAMGNTDTGLGGSGNALATASAEGLYQLKAAREAAQDRAYLMEQRQMARAQDDRAQAAASREAGLYQANMEDRLRDRPFEDEKRDFQREMWKRARGAMNSIGSASASTSGGGSYTVSVR